MKKMILQMAAVQLLMQVVLLVTDLIAEANGLDIGVQTALILSLIPGILFCIFVRCACRITAKSAGGM